MDGDACIEKAEDKISIAEELAERGIELMDLDPQLRQTLKENPQARKDFQQLHLKDPNVQSRIWLWFKCQGVPTLSCDGHIDGVAMIKQQRQNNRLNQQQQKRQHNHQNMHQNHHHRQSSISSSQK